MYIGYICQFYAILCKGSVPVELVQGTTVVNKTSFRFLTRELEGMNCSMVASQDQIAWDVFHMHLIFILFFIFFIFIFFSVWWW